MDNSDFNKLITRIADKRIEINKDKASYSEDVKSQIAFEWEFIKDMANIRIDLGCGEDIGDTVLERTLVLLGN